MRRSICYCEPKKARAGKVSTWKFIYTTATDLPKGAKFKFDMLSEGKPMNWEIPNISSSTKENIIWAEIPGQKNALKPIKVKTDDNLSNQFEFTLPKKLESGESFTIYIGTPLKDTSKKGNRAQTFFQRKKPFMLYINPKDKGDYKEKESFSLDVKGNELKNLRVIVPSMVSRNRRFDVMIRFEDEFGNLTNHAPEGTLIELTYENLRENLNWKLFVPETGFLTLPNLYFNETGIYTLKLTNHVTKEIFHSPPIKCFQEGEESLFWGLFHGEAVRMNATDEIESCLKYFRDEKTLHFYATSPFDDLEEISNDKWKKISQIIAEANEDERFLTFSGSQWVGNPNEEGLREFLYLKENKNILRKKDLKNNSLKKIFKISQAKDLMAIPSFTMGKKSCYDFKDFNPDFEKVVEIYNAWGSSECSKKEGNLFPIEGKACQEDSKGSIVEALNKNYRFGFVAGGLDDRGIYDGFYSSNQKQYTPGLTGIIAKNLTRDSVYNALSNRSCYATTGKRIIIGFNIANQPIGSSLSTAYKPGLLYNRYISGFVIGTTNIKYIEIIRNGKIFNKIIISPDTDSYEFDFDDTDLLNDISISTKDKPDFSYYYMRIMQKDGHMAWSSPIWIDIEEKIVIKKTLKKK